MAVTTDAFVAADLAAVIPEIWTPYLLKELFAKTVAANFFYDITSFMEQGGDIAHIPGWFTNSFSVQTQSTQGAEVTTAGPAMDDVTITVNTHKYVATLLGKKDMKQLSSKYSLNSILAEKMGATVADAIEDTIFALWSGLSTNSVGDTATVLTDLEIRQSIEKLATGNFDLRECAWFFHTYVYWTQIVAIQKYYDASMRGQTSSNGLTLTGNFGPMDASRGLNGSIYGIPVFTSTNVVSGLQTYRNLLAHRTAFGWGFQSDNKVDVAADYLLQNLGLLTVADTIYGAGEMRDAAAVVVNANTSATTS